MFEFQVPPVDRKDLCLFLYSEEGFHEGSVSGRLRRGEGDLKGRDYSSGAGRKG